MGLCFVNTDQASVHQYQSLHSAIALNVIIPDRFMENVEIFMVEGWVEDVEDKTLRESPRR